jgi:hypothetical protein
MPEKKLDAKGTLRLEEAVRPRNFEINFSAPSVYRALLVLNSIPPSTVNLIRLAIMDRQLRRRGNWRQGHKRAIGSGSSEA